MLYHFRQPTTNNNINTPGNYLVFSGWTVVQGSVAKYMWSADGGSTWHEIELYANTAISNAGQNILTAVNGKGLGHTFTEDDAVNGAYQSSADMSVVKGIAANLSEYSGSTVTVILAAVPALATDTLCVITVVNGVQVP